MGNFYLDPKNDLITITENNQKIKVYKHESFNNFNPSILGLGDLTQKSRQIPAVSVMIDLSGFTNFCKQVDPDLSIPIFMTRYLTFLFDEIRAQTVRKKYDEGVALYSSL